ncbi:MAG: amidohydrolase family protein [Actinobacteria bacterium]|nr:amidohydrolase family protein [Actinomycetota bacterium]
MYVADGHITFDEPGGGADTIFNGGWITPGLVDAHAHLPMASPAGEDATEEERVRASLGAHLDAGVLVVREPGAPSHASAHVHDDRLPHVRSAGRFIAPVGRYFAGLAREIDPSDLARAVTEEAAVGGGWVKIIGDFFEEGGPTEPNWTGAQFAIAADAAHAAGARIAVHATCTEAIGFAVDAGFDTIEHGHGMTTELVQAMADAGTAYTPTMSIGRPLRKFFATMPPAAVARNNALLDAQPSMVAAAARAGVTLLAGTDAGMVPHGVVAGEVDLMLTAGVAPEVALGAASWAAREYLGYQGVEEGAPADIVVFADDPRRELRPPALVMLGGRVTKTAR